jgi:hypothetical protein
MCNLSVAHLIVISKVVPGLCVCCVEGLLLWEHCIAWLRLMQA